MTRTELERLGDAELAERIAELNEAAAGRRFTDSEREEWNTANELADERKVRTERIRELFARGDPGNLEAGTYFPPTRPGASQREDRRRLVDPGTARSAALGVVEKHTATGELRSEAADRLDDYIRRDTIGVDARYLAAVASADYNSAFGKMLADPVMGHHRMSPAEVAAVGRVTAVMPGSGSSARPEGSSSSTSTARKGARRSSRTLVRSRPRAARPAGVRATGPTGGFGCLQGPTCRAGACWRPASS
jgi:hypothetical protein